MKLYIKEVVPLLHEIGTIQNFKGKNTLYVPNLRFLEFDNEWVKIPIKNLLKFQNGINADKTKYGKGIKYISVTDILNNKFITYDLIKGLVDIDANTLKHYIVEYGDILFQRSSETFEDIGRSNVYLDKNIPATFGGFVIRGKKIGEYDPIFFKYHLDSPCSRKKVIRMGAGAQHFNIGQDGLEQIELKFPIIKEQEKISAFLLLIDERISTQSKIIENLKSLMKAICHRIFMNEKTRKLSDCVNCNASTLIEANLEEREHGIFPVFGATGIIRYVDAYDIDEDAILVLKDGANAGKVQYAPKCHSVIGTSNYLTSKTSVLLKYVYFALLSFNFDKYKVGSGIPHIYFKDYKEEKIYYPSDEEQKKIVNLLSRIEEKIEVEQLLLEKLKEQKKYLLSNMFI